MVAPSDQRYKCASCSLILQKLPGHATTVLSDAAARKLPHKIPGEITPCNGVWYPHSAGPLKRSASSAGLSSSENDSSSTHPDTGNPKKMARKAQDAETKMIAESAKALSTLSGADEKPEKGFVRGFFIDRPTWCYTHHSSAHHTNDCVPLEWDTPKDYSFNAHGKTVFTNEKALEPIGKVGGLTPEIDLLRATFSWSASHLVKYKTFVRLRDQAIEKILQHIDKLEEQGALTIKQTANVDYLFTKANQATEAVIRILMQHTLQKDCRDKPFQRLEALPMFESKSGETTDLESMIAKLVAGPADGEDWQQPLVPAGSMELIQNKIQSAKHVYWDRNADINRRIRLLVEGSAAFRHQKNPLVYNCLQLVKYTMLQIDDSKDIGCFYFPDLSAIVNEFAVRNQIDFKSS